MIVFKIKPPSPFFSALLMPDYDGLLGIELTPSYWAVNERGIKEFHVLIEYWLKGVTDQVRFLFHKSEFRYTLSSGKDDVVSVADLNEVTMRSIMALKDFLQDTDAPAFLKNLPPIVLKPRTPVLERCVGILNSR